MLTNAVIQDNVSVKIKQILYKVLGVDDTISINDETNLFEIGLVSINVVEVLTQIEEVFQFTIEIEDVSADLFTNFGTLKKFVKGKIL